MCGRTACTLAPHQICQASSFSSKSSSTKKNFSPPQWRDHPGNHTYSPSTNIAPSMYSPVLIKNTMPNSGVKRDIDGNEKLEGKYVVQPMMWGLIPPFFKGESPKGHGFKTSNCRIENISDKRTYKPSLNKGQRCVVLCEGFYEWQTTKGSKNKQPYFIHAPQQDGVEIWNKENWQSDKLWSEDEGWKGAQLLKMAGLYSHWTSSKGEEVHSYTVITMESDKKFSWLHHRIPAILETWEDVENWLEEKDYKLAISELRNGVTVSSYPVSTKVNNVRNQDENLLAPVTTERKVPDSSSSKFMSAWLSSSTKTERPKRKVTKQEEKPKGIKKWLLKKENN